MLCLGRLLLKTESIIITSLPNLFVSASVFLPGACSVPFWAKPRSLVCAGWCVSTWARSLARTRLPFPCRGRCISAKLSYVSALL